MSDWAKSCCWCWYLQDATVAAAIKAELAAANEVGDEDLVIKWGDKGETTKTGIHTNLTTKN